MAKSSKKSLARNKKAYAEYEILEDYEAGIQLTGSEVKSCRASNVNLKGSHVSARDGQVWTENIHISHYKHSQDKTSEPLRQRKLLLNKKEIEKIQSQLDTRGITVIPLELYLKGSLIKLRIGICRGKKQHDRRHDLKEKAQNLEVKRALKRFI